jgi:hypothetical protein
MRKQSTDDQRDAYYMSISGTSMATPHVSGLVALLWQAAPSMRMSEIHDDYNEGDASYWNNSETRIHEVEWILEASARYINSTSENGVPDNSSIGVIGRSYDFAQGYGNVQADRAVGLALTLEELRHEDPDATVADALKTYLNVSVERMTPMETNKLKTQWFGDWSRLVDGNQATFTYHPKHVYIPNGTEVVDVDLGYTPAKSDGWTISIVTLEIDFNGDGSPDWTGDSAYSNRGHKTWQLPVSESDVVWSFTVTGQAVQIPDWWRWRQPGDNEFNEVTIEYTVGLGLTLNIPEGESVTVIPPDLHASYAQLEYAEPESNYTGGYIVMNSTYFDLQYAKLPPSPPPLEEEKFEFPWWGWLLLVILLLAILYFAWKKYGKGNLKMPVKMPALKRPKSVKKAAKSDEVVEAELVEEAADKKEGEKSKQET